MTAALLKDFFREIRISFNRFISIFAIVFVGAAFFAGVKATAPDMKHSMDLYYDKYNLMDIRVMSTLGLTDEDIKAIRSVDRVHDVQPGYFTDVVSTIGSTEYVFRVHSIPSERIRKSNRNYINRFKLTEGRYPEKSGECIIEDSSLIEPGLSVGDVIKVSSGKENESIGDILVVDEFTVVGKAVTPYYLSYEKGPSEVGSGYVNSFMMILDKDFAYPVYTEALVTVEGAKQLNSYGKEYKDLVSGVVTSLENLGQDRSALRLEEIRKQAMDELEKAKEDFNAQKRHFTETIQKAEKELNQAQMKLVEGEAALETEKKNFEEYYARTSKEIEDAERQITKARVEYERARDEYNRILEEYGGELKILSTISGGISGLLQEVQKEIDSLNELLEDPELTEEERKSIQRLIKLYEILDRYIDQTVGIVVDLDNLIQGQVAKAGEQFDKAKNQLDIQSAELAVAKGQLIDAKREAEAKFAAAQRQIREGWKEYEKGKREYDRQRAEGEKKIEEGQEKIIRAENEIEKLSKPQWYVLDRSYHYSYVDYEKTADQIDRIAKIFPVFFFIVAGLVCLTTMTRMVDEQRVTIGVYKALGYRSRSIALKYVLYAAVASLFGGVLGVIIGMRVFPEVIYKSWSMLYTLPPFHTVQQIPLMVVSVLVGMLATTLSALWACYKELQEAPATLMRLKAPTAGRKIFLERSSMLWENLSFSQKVTARNMFRYKKRFFMTVVGVAGCSALLLAGFGLSDSISQIVKKQYGEIFIYDLNVRYTALATEEDKQRVMNILNENDNVESYLAGTEINAKLRGKGDDIPVTLIIPSDPARLREYITLRDRNSQIPVKISDKGIVISEKLAKELNAGSGDTVELDNGDGARKKVVISGIAENYIFHYAYMTPDYYNEIFRLNPKINNLMVKLDEAGTEAEHKLGSLLIKDEGVGSVVYYSAAAAYFKDTVKILNSIVIVIIISAGLLALVVMYNLTNINIGERIREIATIKVLGFYDHEVSAYVYRENMVISIIGSIAGLFAGTFLHRYIMVSIEQEEVMFGSHIDGISFVYSFLITMGFVVLVNILMYRRLKNIPMVESLKSVE